jgi:uncharacterized lipoprotein NlpE involved in copper resistance
MKDRLLIDHQGVDVTNQINSMQQTQQTNVAGESLCNYGAAAPVFLVYFEQF